MLRKQLGSSLRWVRTYRKVFAALLTLVAVYIPLDSLMEGRERQLTAPVTFRYPPERQGGAGDADMPRPDRVYFNSSINDWAFDDYYLMHFDPTNNSWELKIPLDPGNHQYRFALFYPPEAPYWTNIIRYAVDSNKLSLRMYNDEMPRSEHSVSSVKKLRYVIRLIFWLLMAGIALFYPLKFALTRFMRYRISLRFKLITVSLALLLLSNIFFLRLNADHNAEVAQTLQMDTINAIHSMLLSEGMRFQGLANNPSMKNAIDMRLQRFFLQVRQREDYNNFANNSLQITRISVLDTDGNILINAIGRRLRSLLRIYYKNEEELASYYDRLTRRIFDAHKGRPEFSQQLTSFSIFDYFTDDIWHETGEENVQQYQKNTAFFRENGFIMPIRRHQQLWGYYFFEVDGESYSKLFQDNLFTNLGLLTVICLLYFLLMKQTTNIMFSPILSLIKGLNMVRDDHLDYEIKVDTRDEIENLGDAYNFMRIRMQESDKAIEYYTAHLEREIDIRAHELKRANAIYKEDLFLAKRIQRQMLVYEKPDKSDCLDLDVSYSALSEVGGDFYNISRNKATGIRVFLADITGHGVPAALVTMLLKSEYEKIKNFGDPVLVLQIINDAFVTTYGSLTVFFTGIIVDVDTLNMRLRYACAGHPSQYLVRGKECIPLSGHGRIIGVVADPELTLEERALEENDCIFLFTDGLLEQINPQNEEYGEGRIMEVLSREAARRSCAELNQEILSDLKRFQGEQEFIDDMALICIRCLKKERKIGRM